MEKSLCLRFNGLRPAGGRISPDLTGIASHFSRSHLIESILEPSRAAAPGYETLGLQFENERIMSGIRVSESDQLLVLGDKQGKLHNMSTTDIEENTTQSESTVRDGLEKKLTDSAFAGVPVFLESERTPHAR